MDKGFQSHLIWPTSEECSRLSRPVGWRKATSDITQKFTGKERDLETGLDYFGARYYGSVLGRMTSPDSGVDQHPEDPQSWNLYTYARNNPLLYVDPTGQYVCGSGVTKEMCDNFQKQLDAAQEGANNLKKQYGANSTQYKEAQRAIDAYGRENVDNGVTLQLGNTEGEAGGVGRNVGSTAPTADNPNGQKITVTFGADMFTGSADNANTVAHEGSHVADAADWAKSGFAQSTNPTRYGTEYRAFQVERNMAEGTNWGPLGFFIGSQQQYIWRPGWTPAQVDQAIKSLLGNKQGPYHFTEQSKIRAFQQNTRGGR